MSRLAGRCECGIRLDLAMGDEHLACRGERRCRVCGVPKRVTEFPPHYRSQRAPSRQCTACYYAARAARRAAREAADPEYLRRRREDQRASAARRRRRGARAYQNDKATKRARYRNDPAHREREKARVRAWLARKVPAPVHQAKDLIHESNRDQETANRAEKSISGTASEHCSSAAKTPSSTLGTKENLQTGTVFDGSGRHSGPCDLQSAPRRERIMRVA